MDIVHARRFRNNRYDFNDDGYVNNLELEMIRNHILGINVLTGDMFRRVDVNGDGVIDIRDMAEVRRDIINYQVFESNIEEVAIIERFRRYNIVLSSDSLRDANDWEMKFSYEEWIQYEIAEGDYIYIPNSEFGGIVKTIRNNGNEVLIGGPNFRTTLYNSIVTPPVVVEQVGQRIRVIRFGSYYNYDSDIGLIVYDLINRSPYVREDGSPVEQKFNDDLFCTPEDVGYKLKGRIRYKSLLSSLDELLYSTNFRISLAHRYFGESDYIDNRNVQGRTHICELKVQERKDYSDTAFFDNDYNAIVTSSIDESKVIRYCIALGKGELENREVFVYEFDEKFAVAKEVDYTLAPIFNYDVFVYDNPNAETKDDIVAAVTKIFIENARKMSVGLDINNSQIDFNLGDIVGGKDLVTGIEVSKVIVQKELTIENNRINYKYKVGE